MAGCLFICCRWGPPIGWRPAIPAFPIGRCGCGLKNEDNLSFYCIFNLSDTDLWSYCIIQKYTINDLLKKPNRQEN